jgi:hypothetical protein
VIDVRVRFAALSRLVAVSISMAAAASLLSSAGAAAANNNVGTPDGMTGTWSPSLTSSPAPPIYTCVGNLHIQGNGFVTAQAYAQCDAQLDQITYSWTFVDSRSGTVLFTDGGQQRSTTSLSTGEAQSVGTPGLRNVEVCFETYLSGSTPAGDCLWQNGV